jgi:hypothetical protein
MSLRIDQVDTEIEVLRREEPAGPTRQPSSVAAGIDEAMSTQRGRAELREKLRPIVMEILTDELDRIKRKVGAP